MHDIICMTIGLALLVERRLVTYTDTQKHGYKAI